jgi:hypothetical protein
MRAVVAALALLVACSGGGGAGGEAEKHPEPQKPAAGGEFELSWFGLLSKTYDGGLASCADATKQALRRLDIGITEEKGGIFQTTFEAESKDGTSLVVILKELGKTSTRIGVKVGYLLGDKDAAQRIHSELQAEFDARKLGRGAGGAPRAPDSPGRPLP